MRKNHRAFPSKEFLTKSFQLDKELARVRDLKALERRVAYLEKRISVKKR